VNSTRRGWPMLAVVSAAAALLATAIFGQGSSIFLLDLPGDRVGVRYSHGSLDRAVQLQDNFDALIEDFRGWTRAKVGLVILLLNRDEWKESGFTNPYGVAEPAGGRGIAMPAWGDDGTVQIWRQLLGSRLPMLPDQPFRGTPEQEASLAVADLNATVDGARILLRAAGISGDQPWVDGVLTLAVVLSNIQGHHATRLSDVRMIYEDFARTGGGPAAYPLDAAAAPPSLAARLWFDSQFFSAANLLVGPGGKYPAKAIFKQARKNGGRVLAAELMAKCPELGTWLKTSFKTN